MVNPVARFASYRPALLSQAGLLAALMALLFPLPVAGQASGEILEAWVLDVGADAFGCGAGAGCTLRYRLYNVAGGQPEVNQGANMDGYPRYRRRGAYQTDAALSGNFAAVAGKWDIPFFVVWDGVINPGSGSHVGYYGAQSQILSFGEVGDSSQVNCHGGQQASACFEPLTSQNTSLSLGSGHSAIGGLAPIPVPRALSSLSGSVSLEWDEARGSVTTDGAPSALAGYRVYAFSGRDPSQSALTSARLVAEVPSIGSTRVTIQGEHPGMPRSGDVTFVLKLVYVGNLESLYFSANSEAVQLEGDEEEDDEESDDEEDDPLDDDADGEGDEGGPDDDPASTPDDLGAAGGAQGAAGSGAGGGAASTTAGGVAGAGSAGGAAAGGTTDPDGDGIPRPGDNCPGLWNPEQLDGDGDGSGDACDGDADGDRIPDDLDCDAGDSRAGLEALPPPLLLVVGTQPDHLLTWAGAGGHWLLYRGRREPGETFRYNHVCRSGNLAEGQAGDEQIPPPDGLFYYLVTGDSACGPAPPGRRSDGGRRPGGPGCLAVEMVGEEAGEDGPGPWTIEARGGRGLPVEIELRLPSAGGMAQLRAVSLAIAYPPQALSPLGSPLAGPLLAEDQAPARIDFAPAAGAGRMQVTVARTGLGAAGAGTDGESILVTLRWRQLLPGTVEIRLENVQALDADFAPLPLPGAVFRLHTP